MCTCAASTLSPNLIARLLKILIFSSSPIIGFNTDSIAQTRKSPSLLSHHFSKINSGFIFNLILFIFFSFCA